MRRRLGTVIVAAMLIAACGGETSPEGGGTTKGDAGPAAEEVLLADYAAALSAGEIGRALRYFSPDPVVRRHPFALNDYMDRTSELRATEELVPTVQGSGAGLEFFDIEVSDGTSSISPDVTFRWRFFYGADGSESGGEAGCIGGKDGKAYILGSRFTEFNWGFEDPTACDG